MSLVDPDRADGGPWCVGGTVGTDQDLLGSRVALESRPWLLVVDERPLMDEVIGCVHWWVVFCDNPFGDDPAFGEASVA